MKPTPLVIVGAGGFGREVLDVVEAINLQGSPHSSSQSFDFLGFLDDGPVDAELLERRGAKHLGSVALAKEFHGDVAFALAIGWPEARRALEQALRQFELTYVVLVHPTAWVGSRCSLASGAVVRANASLMTEVTLGRHTHVHANAAVGHDARLGDLVTILPGATVGGGVQIGSEVLLGANTAVNQGVNIGAATKVGSGAAVIGDLDARVVAVGVPARSITRS